MPQMFFRDMPPSEWDKYIAVNLYGVLNCTKAVVEGMCEQGWGRIIMISSEAGRSGLDIVDHDALLALLDLPCLVQLQHARMRWVNQALAGEPLQRETHWSESLAVGREAFITEFHVCWRSRRCTVQSVALTRTATSCARSPSLTSRFFGTKS